VIASHLIKFGALILMTNLFANILSGCVTTASTQKPTVSEGSGMLDGKGQIVSNFQDPLDTAVFTTTFVLKENEPILHVSHDDDGAWQFHSGNAGVDTTTAMLVSLQNVLDHDATVNEVSDLPLGHYASRESLGAPWVRAKQ